MVAPWTQPLASSIDLKLAAFRTATDTGDLTFACYSLSQTIADLLVRNDPLDVVWRECERSLDFVRKANFRDVADVISSQQLFIAAMQGRTETLSTFSDEQFDEARFEKQLAGRMPVMTYIYWALKLKARFLSGHYAEAHASAEKAKALLWAATAQIHLLDYFFYAALTVAALYETASADDRAEWRELLMAHNAQLREWADHYPPTFADKQALVLAELARIDGRDAEAMELYEQAIDSAHEHGFVQNEGLAQEIAARFYAAHGVESFARICLRNARDCYLRWGATGKVSQLERQHPHLREKQITAPITATFGAPVDQLDVGTVVKASQVMSGEIELSKLVQTLMRIAIEHAGAERGLLIFRGDMLQVEAEARLERTTVEVILRQGSVTPAELPEFAPPYRNSNAKMRDP